MLIIHAFHRINTPTVNQNRKKIYTSKKKNSVNKATFSLHVFMLPYLSARKFIQFEKKTTTFNWLSLLFLFCVFFCSCADTVHITFFFHAFSSRLVSDVIIQRVYKKINRTHVLISGRLFGMPCYLFIILLFTSNCYALFVCISFQCDKQW